MKNSGVSMITLVVMIVIMIILASIAVTSGIDSVNEANKTKLEVEITELKKAVSSRMVEIERDSTVAMPGQKTEDIVEYIYYVEDLSNEDLEDFIRGVNAETIDYYRIVDSVSAAALGVSSVNTEHYFIVDYYTGKVYGNLNMAAYKADKNGVMPE
ncbi:MAG: hypothetical protein IJX99_06280 [Clostridia bacterium]|nr:hypothetical protein [Clostridia bacterium]